MVVLNKETRAMVVLNKRNSSNGGTQQNETRAMVVLNRRNNRRKASNGGTQQKETQKDDMRDNQTCVMNADSNQGFAAAARATGKTAQAAGRSRGHRPTCDGEQNPRSRYRTKTVS